MTGDRCCKDPIVSGGTQAGAVPCKPRLSKQSENKISPLSNENLGLNVGIVMLRKTKLYLDKTIKVESAESTSHTGNGWYKELSVFNRALGKGGGSGLRSAAESRHRESLALCFPLPAPRPGEVRSLPAKGALLPAALKAVAHSRELHRRSSAAGPFPGHLQTAPGWVAVRRRCQPARSFSGCVLLFFFGWSSFSSYPRCSLNAREYLT